MSSSYKFIVNPVAGGGRAAAMMPEVERRFREAGADYSIYRTTGPGDAIQAAKAAAGEGYSVIVAAGGDGTVNEVLNGIVGSNSVLAAIHGGKGNDFAIAVNMPRDVDAACRVLLAAQTKMIDLGRVLNRYFINSVGVGFDAAVALRVNRGVKPFTGVSAYIYAFFLTLFAYESVEMEIDLGRGPFTTRPVLVAVGIGPNYGGGMRIVPDAIQDDGLFDICIMEDMNRTRLFYHFPKVFSGSHKYIREASMHRSSEVRLRLAEARPLHMEGEILFGDSMHFTIQRQAMKVLANVTERKEEPA